jgi:hypothetical protein
LLGCDCGVGYGVPGEEDVAHVKDYGADGRHCSCGCG